MASGLEELAAHGGTGTWEHDGPASGTEPGRGPLGSLYSILPTRTDSLSEGSVYHYPQHEAFSFSSSILFSQQISMEPLLCQALSKSGTYMEYKGSHSIPSSQEAHSWGWRWRQSDKYSVKCVVLREIQGLVLILLVWLQLGGDP